MSKEAAMAFATGQPAPAAPETIAPEGVASVGPEAVIPPPVKDLDSDRFAKIAKKEAEFVKRQQALKAEQEQFESRRKETEEILKRRDQFEETRKQNPIEALKLIGFSEADIFNFLAANEKAPLDPVEAAKLEAQKTVEERFKEYEKVQAEKEAKVQSERDNKALGQFKNDMSSLVTSNTDKYEYAHHFGQAAVDLAFQTVLQIVEDSQGEKIPTVEQAMDMVENYYEEQDKLMNVIKKRNPKPSEDPAPAAETAPERSRTVTTPPGGEPVKPAIQRTRTVSNAARPTLGSQAPSKPETMSEKKERLKRQLASYLPYESS